MQHVNLRPEKYEPEELDPSAALAGINRPAFASVEDEMDWHRECQLAINKQRADWCVAPRAFVRSPRTNVVFTSGAELLLTDFSIGQLMILERRGCVTRATEAGKRVANCPPDARWVVAPNQSITAREGVLLLAGAQVEPSMLDAGELAIIDLVARRVVIDRQIKPDAPIAEAATLSLRELELVRATADVEIAKAALAKNDNAKTEKQYVDTKLAVDLATVRVEIARQKLADAEAAEQARKRAKQENDLADLESKIAAQGSEAASYHAGIVKAARGLADALRAAHVHEDGSYQQRVQKNALLQALLGHEIKFEYPPVGRLQKQLMELARVTDVDVLEIQ